MKLILRTLQRKTSGDLVARDKLIAGTPIRLGRGADVEVFLNDPRALLHQATLVERDGAVYVDAAGQATIKIDGHAVTSGRINIGDTFEVGPYALQLLASPETSDADYLLTLELIYPLENIRDSLSERSTLSVEDLGIKAKPWSIALGVIIAVMFLAIPLVEHFNGEANRAVLEIDGPRTVKQIRDANQSGEGEIVPVSMRQFWQSGHLSSSHKILGTDCSACHQEPFQQVANETCTSCHTEAHEHVDAAKFPDASISDTACQTCHKEHEGPEALVLNSEEFCSDCHGNIASVTNGQSELKDIISFESHGAFDYEDATNRPKTGLKFSHKQHLDAEGMKVPDGPMGERRVLSCDSCHQADVTGTVMAKPKFEAVCADCHSLHFEPNAPDRMIPHADVAVAKQYIRDAYASIALHGGFKPRDGETAPKVVRRIPGTKTTGIQKQEALAWAEDKADTVIGGHFGKKLCGTCHEIVEDNKDPLNWTLREMPKGELYLQKGHFNHAPHTSSSCAECHSADQSEDANDLLLPSVTVCKDCHGGDNGSLVPTTCTSCHEFHKENKTKAEVKQ